MNANAFRARAKTTVEDARIIGKTTFKRVTDSANDAYRNTVESFDRFMDNENTQLAIAVTKLAVTAFVALTILHIVANAAVRTGNAVVSPPSGY